VIRSGTGEIRVSYEDVLKKLYAAFNARDLNTLANHLHPDVDWPNGWEGGWLHGRDAARDYWQRQWREIDPHVEPTAFHEDGPDIVRVSVHQVVRDLAGNTQFDGTVTHVYQFTDGLVRRMTIQNRAAAAPQ
jgi:ketosteroid isomerase-like protein